MYDVCICMYVGYVCMCHNVCTFNAMYNNDKFREAYAAQKRLQGLCIKIVNDTVKLKGMIC